MTEPKAEVHNHYSLLGNLEGCVYAVVIIVFLVFLNAGDAVRIIRALLGQP